ncbi:MAG: pectate lyase [Armatimonadota bacterium]|jgi:PelA/Pel-15E family pectate lyase
MRRGLTILALICVIAAPAAADEELTALAELARSTMTAAVDALISRDMPDGVAEIESMERANLYETERPPVYADVLLAAYTTTGEERFRDHFLAVADLCVAMKQPEGGYARKAWVKRVGAEETTADLMTFRNSRSLKAVRVVLGAYDLTSDERYLASAIETAEFTLSAQHPDGAWNSDYPAPPRSYLELPMLNDLVTISSVRELMLLHSYTDDPRYLAAARRTGQWFIDRQLDEPTPGWAQHYDFDGKPAWGRRFEPPSACSAPSIEAIDVLIDIHLLTGDARYLAPIPAALAWLDRARTGENEWARFYEVGTGRPLYASIDHRPWLRYTRDDELYKGYAQWGGWPFERRRARWQRLQEIGRDGLLAEEAAPASEDELRALVESDAEWIRATCAEGGTLAGYSADPGNPNSVSQNVRRAARWLAAVEALTGD